jgi:hypothetical protein
MEYLRFDRITKNGNGSTLFVNGDIHKASYKMANGQGGFTESTVGNDLPMQKAKSSRYLFPW